MMRVVPITKLCFLLPHMAMSHIGTNKNDNKRIEAFELRCYRRLLMVSWKGNRTKNWVLEKIDSPLILSDTTRKRKLSYFSHIMRTLQKQVLIY